MATMAVSPMYQKILQADNISRVLYHVFIRRGSLRGYGSCLFSLSLRIRKVLSVHVRAVLTLSCTVHG